MTVPPPGPAGPDKPADREPSDREIAWGVASKEERRIPASVAVLLAILLQLFLPERVVQGLGPRWLVPTMEGALGVALIVASPGRLIESARLRIVSLSLISLINLANVISLVELIHALLYGSKAAGRPLIYASVPLWLTNVIVFALWYWELDRGGPAVRLRSTHRKPDFLFPQQSTPGVSDRWTPKFFDYFYTSFTNATAFSPTDTMPLTIWAKLLMMAQSAASLLIVALVVSRAVNILS